MMRGTKTSIALLVLIVGCGRVVQKDSLSEITSTKTGNPISSSSNLSIAPFEGGLTSLTLCLANINLERTRGRGNSTSNWKISIYREVTISPQGTNLDIELPAATYRSIEFEIRDTCPSGKSVQLTNDFGTFSTDENINIVFRGDVSKTQSPDSVELLFQKVAEDLGRVRGDSEIKYRAEAGGGCY